MLRRTTKKYSLETPSYNDQSTDDEGRPVLWFTGNGKKLLIIKGEQEKKRVFTECYASNYGGHCGKDNRKSAKDISGQSITTTQFQW